MIFINDIRGETVFVVFYTTKVTMEVLMSVLEIKKIIEFLDAPPRRRSYHSICDATSVSVVDFGNGEIEISVREKNNFLILIIPPEDTAKMAGDIREEIEEFDENE